MTAQFEGPEKKIEIILSKPMPDLRSNADGRWHRVVKASRSEIISSASTPAMDAYLLSESSLFVWDSRILMITCGQTSLIDAIPEILKLVEKEDIGFLFYERKNLMYPKSQLSDFEVEAAMISAIFPGKSYRLGPANHDHVHIFYSSHASVTTGDDATLELLMHDLNPKAGEIYAASGGRTLENIIRLTGLDSLCPDMTIDSFLFEPFGYSLNAIRDNSYFTIHVTPQPNGSYASFETNQVDSNYLSLVSRVLNIFQPARFTFVLTSSVTDQRIAFAAPLPDNIDGFRPTEKSIYELDCGYQVRFSNYICC